MITIDISEVSALSPLVQPGSHEPIVLMQNGKTVAAIVPIDEKDVESLLLSIDPQFQSILERSQSRLDAEGGLSSDEVRAKLGLPSSAKN